MSNVWLFAILGLRAGGAYGLTALGVVAIYRGTGVLNFAQGAIGMVGTFAFWEVYRNGAGLPLYVALPLGICTGSAVAVVAYATVLRPLRHASEVVRLIATLGILLILQGAATVHYGVEAKIVDPFLGTRTFDVLGTVVSQEVIVILAVAIASAVALTLLFQRTRLGITATALRERPLAASVLGISPDPTGITCWAIGGGLAALAGIILVPLTGLSPTGLTQLIIPAFAAGLLAGFRSMWITLVAGLGMGIAESILVSQQFSTGLTASLPFVVIILALVLRGRTIPGRGEDEQQRLPRLGTGSVNVVRAVVVAVLVVGITLSLPASWDDAVTTSAIFGLIGLSLVVVTGYAGQVNLAPMALAGAASLFAVRAAAYWHFPFLASVAFGVVAAVLIGIVVGAPAVRVRGVNLAIATIGLALVLENAVLGSPGLTGGVTGIEVPTPSIGGYQLDPGAYPARYAVFCVLCLALAAVAVANVRRGRSGRRYVAVRANERGAAALGVSVAEAKLGAFAISAGIAGLAGALVGFRSRIAVFEQFDVYRSITALGFAIVGGIGFVSGGVAVGLLATGGLLARIFLDLSAIDPYLPILSGVFVIHTLLQSPDGISAKVAPVASRFWSAAAKRLIALRRPPHDDRAPRAASRGHRERAALARDHVVPSDAPLLTVTGLTVRYGGTTALEKVNLEVSSGKVLGIIGPNGAGKTTLIDAISGFVRPVEGAITLHGRDVLGMGPVSRARRGIARTFQNLELFEDLPVAENVLAALDSRDRLAYLSDLVRPGHSLPSDDVTAILESLGLGDDAATLVADLPQGRRRMVAIARAVATRPVVLCLDEPAAGLSAVEREKLSDVIRELAAQRQIGILLIEHNVEVVANACDWVIALDFGRVVASGTPHDVLAADAVRQSYLGIDVAVRDVQRVR
ncbi:MAG TPA: ATP-binding cassette domain-containing protein [Candidatus Dormibacteraeota bacterium]|jgi:sulfate-transporting ATPase|nr:ATP-binding cassette domain-containing protein [Candidatus Dormibacteraeota bacterium]